MILSCLIIDDEPPAHKVLENYIGKVNSLSLAGNCYNAIEALNFLHKHPVDILFLDINMPEVDGFTLTEWIRQDPDLRDTVVILLTSAVRSDDQARCDELNVAAHLMKPVKQSDLLNAITASLGSDSKGQEASPLPSDESAMLPSLDILVVEDGLMNQRLAVGLLEKRRHSVVVAGNGKEAVAALDSRPFDVVLMDVEMPEMDGIEATAVIRAKESECGGHVPIIAMTAHAMKGDRDRCLAAGMDGYVSKPIRAQQLYDELRSVLGDVEN